MKNELDKRWRTVVRGPGVAAARRREQHGAIWDVRSESLGLDVETGEEWFQISWREYPKKGSA